MLDALRVIFAKLLYARIVFFSLSWYKNRHKDFSVYIAVGLSGGIDSSMAAKQLCDQGHRVCGITFKLLYDHERWAGVQERMLTEAAQAAENLGIEHRIYDFRGVFRQQVIRYFVDSYRIGETPNPCYICNKQIKFGVFLSRALEDGFDAIATGHYAKTIRNEDGRFLLAQAADKDKDQSYFLALLDQRQLQHTLFPLADITKAEVRRKAEMLGLVNARKADSQDICFVPDGDYAAFIEAEAPEAFRPGAFIDMQGNTVGVHRGLHHYTIGQRRGLALAFGYPVYVVEKCAVGNTVRVGAEADISVSACMVRQVNWIIEPSGADSTVWIKTRDRQKPKKVHITILDPYSVRAVFESPEKAVAKGQAAVFYQGSFVLAGGIISEVCYEREQGSE